jgi:HEPN domain-containing protein
MKGLYRNILFMFDEVQNWIESAEYDLETAEHLFASKRYIYAVFMCHLALEKILKARLEEITGQEPPKTHDLKYLLDLTSLSPNEKMKRHIVEIGAKSVVTRYPVDFKQMLRDFSSELVEQILQETREVFGWIRKSIRQ